MGLGIPFAIKRDPKIPGKAADAVQDTIKRVRAAVAHLAPGTRAYVLRSAAEFETAVDHEVMRLEQDQLMREVGQQSGILMRPPGSVLGGVTEGQLTQEELDALNKEP